MSTGNPFDASAAKDGTILSGIDPTSLTAGRPSLQRLRLERQRQLLRQGTIRFTNITVTTNGVIYDGNHGARAAAEEGESVVVSVIDEPSSGFGPILSIPILDR